jgi:hypothetical protein
MMQHGHGVYADADPELAHRKAELAVARQQVEGRIQDGISVEAPPSARAGRGFPCRFR